MKAADFAEWRVGLGRWEFGTLLLPTLTDGSVCSLQQIPPQAKAPPGTTDLDLIGARNWFTYTDGTPEPELAYAWNPSVDGFTSSGPGKVVGEVVKALHEASC
ncbi:MAG TPA: hypothetical protein VHQ90_15185 [Thermoanaerobaculia bacterium]|nr:hypothetical protein [Thermoanaerobaculia bacterium]